MTLRVGSIYQTADGRNVRVISADEDGVVLRYADGSVVAVSA